MKEQNSIYVLAKATTELEQKLQAINEEIKQKVHFTFEELETRVEDPKVIFKREMEALAQAFKKCKVKTGDLMKGIEASRRRLKITTELEKGKLRVKNMQRDIKEFRESLKQKAVKHGSGDPEYLNFPDFLLVRYLNERLAAERESVKNLEKELRLCQYKLLKIRASITKTAPDETELSLNQLES